MRLIAIALVLAAGAACNSAQPAPAAPSPMVPPAAPVADATPVTPPDAAPLPDAALATGFGSVGGHERRGAPILSKIIGLTDDNRAFTDGIRDAIGGGAKTSIIATTRTS